MSRLSLCACLAVIMFGTASAQTNPYTWQLTTNGTFNTAANWLNGAAAPEVPPSTATTQLIFNAAGTTSYTATNDLGAFMLNSIQFNNTGTGTISLAGNDLVPAGTTPTFSRTGAAFVMNAITGISPLTLT